MRMLTSKFGTFRIAKYEKSTGKSIMDILDVGNFEVNKIADIIKLGSPEIPMDDQEKAYEKLDNYLAASEDNSLITAYIDLIDDINKDLKLFMGVNMDTIREKLRKETTALTDKVNNMVVEDNDNKVIELPQTEA